MDFKKALEKTIALVISVLLLVGMSTGCVSKNTSGMNNGDGKVVISVGNWPAETDPRREASDKNLHNFMEKHPNIIVQPDTWAYDPKTFMIKASANQLPTIYNSHFTETTKIKSGGYAADITEAMRKFGFSESINPDLLGLVTDENGRIFAVPYNAYAQGLYINKSLFREAELVNVDGSINAPVTYQQLAEYARIVKEKTGKAGFILPTTGNGGGWVFLNIAWSFGVEFVEQQANGKWKATFDTPEFRKALQYIYDLKWKYGALPDNAVIDITEYQKLFGTGQGAMTILHPGAGGGLSRNYGINIDDLMLVRLPEGEAGRFAQMGGGIHVISPNASSDEIEACFTWLKFGGFTPEVTDEVKQTLADNAKETVEINGVVLGRNTFNFWVNPERLKAIEDAEKPYINVNPKDYDDYFSFEDVIIRPEPSIAAQELYAVLDRAIQELITNKSADINAIARMAANDFQINHLDKLD